MFYDFHPGKFLMTFKTLFFVFDLILKAKLHPRYSPPIFWPAARRRRHNNVGSGLYFKCAQRVIAVAADMNKLFSEFKYTDRWSVSLPSSYLCVYKGWKSAKAQAEIWAGQQISGGQLFMSAVIAVTKTWSRIFIGQPNFISHAFLFGEYVSWSLAFRPKSPLCLIERSFM